MQKHVPDVVKLMTPFPHTIEASASLAEASAMIEEHDIAFLPVTESANLIGTITRRDIRLAHALLPPEQRESLQVKDLCSYDPYIIETSEKAVTVISHMRDNDLSSALVVRHGRLVGIVTCTNAYDLLVRYLQGRSGSDNIPDIPA